MDNPQNPVIWKNYFVQDTGDHLCLIVFIGNKAVRKFIVISMAVLTAEPANHQLLLSAAFLFGIRGLESL